MQVTWNDGYNPVFTGSVTVDPESGAGNKTITVSDGTNESLDMSCSVTVSLNSGGSSKAVKVNQKGKRQVFCTGDGVPYRTGDGLTYNVSI